MRRGARQKFNGDAIDWVYGRHWYHWRAGDGKAVKRTLSRQTRYGARQALRKALRQSTPLEGEFWPPEVAEAVL